VVSAAALSVSPAGRRCGVTTLNAVALDATGNGFVGADCHRAGVVGIFTSRNGSWELTAVPVPDSQRTQPIDLLRLRAIGSGLDALIVSGGGTRVVYAVSSDDGGIQWTVGSSWALHGSQLVSSGYDAEGDPILLLGNGASRDAIVASPDGTWRRLPTAPGGTQVVTSGPDGQLDALVVEDTQLVDWVLTSADVWQRRGVVTVPIQFGSSS
jgi:hypothetical protein